MRVMLAENRSVKNPPQLSGHDHIFNYLLFPEYTQNHIVPGHVSITCPTKASPVFSPKLPGTKWTPYTCCTEGWMTDCPKHNVTQFITLWETRRTSFSQQCRQESAHRRRTFCKGRSTLSSPRLSMHPSRARAFLGHPCVCVSAGCSSQPFFTISSSSEFSLLS